MDGTIQEELPVNSPIGIQLFLDGYVHCLVSLLLVYRLTASHHLLRVAEGNQSSQPHTIRVRGFVAPSSRQCIDQRPCFYFLPYLSPSRLEDSSPGQETAYRPHLSSRLHTRTFPDHPRRYLFL